jgi:cytosine/creatinine deaminase
MARTAILLDGSRVDVVLDGERVAAAGPRVGSAVADRVGARGGLLLPAFIETDIHLDKVLIRAQLAEHDGTLRGAIDAIHAAKRAYAQDDVRRRARTTITRELCPMSELASSSSAQRVLRVCLTSASEEGA